VQPRDALQRRLADPHSRLNPDAEGLPRTAAPPQRPQRARHPPNGRPRRVQRPTPQPPDRSPAPPHGSDRDYNSEYFSTVLDGWNRMPGRRGLPQRSAASAVLANMYLRPVDDEIMEPSRTRRKRRRRESVFRLLGDLLGCGSARGTSCWRRDDVVGVA
jgi:hypothetical protein